MRMEMKNDIQKTIVVYHGKYLIAKFAFKLDKRQVLIPIAKYIRDIFFQNFIFVH